MLPRVKVTEVTEVVTATITIRKLHLFKESSQVSHKSIFELEKMVF